jgi:hypothetical protein
MNSETRARRDLDSGKQADPRSADGRGEFPAQNLPSPSGANAVDRVVLHLECSPSHNVLVDPDWLEEGNPPPTHEHCWGCGFRVRVVSMSAYRDEDLSR